MSVNLDIESYVGAGELKFGMNQEEVEMILGPPNNVDKSMFTKEVIEYRNNNGIQTVYSQLDEKLVEISFYSNIPNVKFKERDIFSDNGKDIVRFLIKEDGNPLESVGILVFLNLGISMTGFLQEDEPSQKSISVFAKGRWDDDMEDLEPFSLA